VQDGDAAFSCGSKTAPSVYKINCAHKVHATGLQQLAGQGLVAGISDAATKLAIAEPSGGMRTHRPIGQ